MKNHCLHILFLGIYLLISSTLFAQDDIVIEYGVDTTMSEGKYDRIYQVVSEDKVTLNTLIKFDAVQWGQIHPGITVEQRIWKDIIVEPSFTVSSAEWSRTEGIKYAITPDITLKYYFNRARRERMGKNIIGFSGDYISAGLNYSITDDRSFYYYQISDSYIDLPVLADQSITDDLYHYYSWHVLYGLQRRFGKVAYVDVAGGIERNYFGDDGMSKVLPTIRIKIGFALSREQFKRFTR